MTTMFNSGIKVANLKKRMQLSNLCEATDPEGDRPKVSIFYRVLLCRRSISEIFRHPAKGDSARHVGQNLDNCSICGRISQY